MTESQAWHCSTVRCKMFNPNTFYLPVMPAQISGRCILPKFRFTFIKNVNIQNSLLCLQHIGIKWVIHLVHLSNIRIIIERIISPNFPIPHHPLEWDMIVLSATQLRRLIWMKWKGNLLNTDGMVVGKGWNQSKRCQVLQIIGGEVYKKKFLSGQPR